MASRYFREAVARRDKKAIPVGVKRSRAAKLRKWETGEVHKNPKKPATPIPETCPICNKPSDDMVADHCHSSGLSREWICRLCNFGLGMFKDNPEALERAAAYLRKHRERVTQPDPIAWMREQYSNFHPHN